MTRQLRVRSIKKKDVNEEQLALAFLLLAKILHEREQAENQQEVSDDPASSGEAA